MADYERLKGIRTTISAKQGDYLYAPKASGSIFGLVKFPDLIKVVSVLPTLTGDIYDGYTFFVRVGTSKYRIYGVVGSTATERKPAIDALQEIGNVEAAQPTNGDILRWDENEGLFIFSNGLGEAESDIVALELEIAKIKNGTTVVKKAECDDEGDVIKNTYVGLVEVDYNDVTNTINVEARTKDGTYLGDDQITLPKATTTKDGLMAKEDKVKVDNIASDISSAITTHDNSATAHLPLRTLINDLQKEIDRLNAKGRSWGEVDKTFSELWAMTEPTRSDYINTFLANNFSGYTPSNGDLVYTIVSDTEEEHELEYNSTLSQWVDNGSYIVGKASNTQMGIVKGDLTYVSILNGLIQVLKSDYATNVGSSGASYDYDDLLALFTEVANDIYKKNETYSATQIEQRITDLLVLANLQDTAIEYETGNYVFPRGAVFPATLVSAYNWVFLRFITAGQEVRYNFFKPTEASSGNYMTVPVQKSPARYARIMRDNGNLKFDIVNDANVVQTDLACTMKVWGIKLDGIAAEEVSYDNTGSTLKSTTVQGAIDEHDREIEELKYAPIINKSYVDKINATTDFVPNASGKPLLKQVDGLQVYAPQLVTNGDFSDGTTGWSSINGNLSVLNNSLITTGNGTNASFLTFSTSSRINGIKYYSNSKLRVNNTVVDFINIFTAGKIKQIYNPVINQLYIESDIQTADDNFTSALAYSTNYANATISDGNSLELFYSYLFNISTLIANKQYSPLYNTTFDLMTDAQIKIQMDSWVQLGVLPNANLQAVTNTKVKTIGKNLSPTNTLSIGGIDATTGLPIDVSANGRTDFILVKPSTQYTFTFGTTNSTGVYVYFYEYNQTYISRALVYTNKTLTFTTPSNCYYVRGMVYIAGGNPSTSITSIQLELGSTATTYAPYKSGTLELTHTPLYRLPNGVKDIVRYDNGQYVKDKYVGVATVSGIVAVNTTNYPLAKNGGQFINYMSGSTEIGVIGTNSTTASGTLLYELATPLLANELVNADGQLIQENQTTVIQEQTLPSLVNIDFTINVKAQVIANKNIIASNYTALDTAKADKVVLTNLITNGNDFASGFTIIGATGSVVGGVYQFTATSQLGRMQTALTYETTDKVYILAKVKASSSNVKLVDSFTYTFKAHTGSGNYELLSLLNTNPLASKTWAVRDDNTTGFAQIDVDYMLAINLTAIFGAGNEPTKEQMDAILTLKGGYFSTATLNVIDVMKLFTPKTQEDWLTPTLTASTTTYLKYRKDTLGTIIVEGNLTVGTAGTNFTLPTGYRPLFTYVVGDLTFNTNGTVVSASTGLKYINVRFASI